MVESTVVTSPTGFVTPGTSGTLRDAGLLAALFQ
jgi:hypothetical protein